MPLGFGVWQWFASNKYAQIAGLVLGAILLWKWNNLVVARQASRKQRVRHREASIKKDQQIKEQSNEAVEQADAIRTGDYESDRMSERPIPSYHYRN